MTRGPLPSRSRGLGVVAGGTVSLALLESSAKLTTGFLINLLHEGCDIAP